MIVTLYIIGVITLIIAIICRGMGVNGWAFILGIIGAYFLSGSRIMHHESCKPTAIDVYKGKTTLEITYKDGVPIDSIVVFKK